MIRRVLIATCVVLILVAAGAGWLMKTESGLRWAWRMAAPWLPYGLEVAEISGSLAGPIELEGLSFADGSLAIATGSVDLDWNPWALAAHRASGNGTESGDGILAGHRARN